ncbi:hypothetical protein H5410_063633 [Solanum commersonii]|uniref:C-JID domain-containing protein n=1 Tax=Solanum commersonii TaxID=4109 RepID=A0A9J5WDR6_SOLCO|nr:hypothetical protein H5410_063633 [Solanum commersonii]
MSGLPEVLGSLHSLKNLCLSRSNISCLPKNINKLSRVHFLNIQFCENLNELPSGELPPNLTLYRLVISNCGAVSSEQVNVFLHHFLRTCIQCDFNQRDYFIISFPGGVKILELFDYDRFVNQKEISIDLNPSWYTDKFMGFWICYGPTTVNSGLEATLVCKSDPERKYSFKYNNNNFRFNEPFICCLYIPFETLWNGEGNKEGKNPNI